MSDVAKYKRAVEDLSALNQISNSVNVYMDVDEICRSVVELATRHIKADQGAIYLLSDEPDGESCLRTFIRDSSSQSVTAPLHLTGSIQGWMLRHQSVLISDDVSSDDRIWSDNSSISPIQSLCAQPLLASGKYLGALVAFNKPKGAVFSNDDIHFLGIVASQTARLVQIAHLSQIQSDIISRQQEDRVTALARLVAGISHELNTPIAAINSTAQTIASIAESLSSDKVFATDSRVPSAMRANMEVLKTSTSRLKELVDRLHRFSSLDRSRITKVKIESLLNSALKLTDRRGKESVKIQTLGEKDATVQCDIAAINTVLQNILQNAIDAVDAIGEVRVHVSKAGDHVHVAVKDSGRGIPAERLDSIFEPQFSREGNRVSLSMGLAICYATMRRLGGNLTISSEVGSGSEALLEIPVGAQSTD